MGTELHILGVRHHGPGSARLVERTLELLRPDCILIEGPPDAHDVLPLARDEAMSPPVALLVYEPDEPASAAYYPFAAFSPEWRALQWGLTQDVPVRFIDLPVAMREKGHAQEAMGNGGERGNGQEAIGNRGEEDSEEAEVVVAGGTPAPREQEDGEEDTAGTPVPPEQEQGKVDPLDALAAAAGFADGEAWWGRLIEERRGEDDPLAVFEAIHAAMADLRSDASRWRRDHEEPAREAHMRQAIRAAMKEGHERIVVVCGAWHAPVLTPEALKNHSVKDDQEVLKGLPKRKVTATWIPWTHSQLSMASGYGAGVLSPGWYEHLWLSHTHVAEGWLTRVARLMREEDLDASSAQVIDGVRLADSLATLRGRTMPGLEELNEAALAVVCNGDDLRLRLIERKLVVGERLGEVPETAPAVPLQRDLAALQKSLRLKVAAVEAILELDLRKETDLARSHLFHRLSVLDITWAAPVADARRSTGTFRETWRLQWAPELAVAVIQAARFGTTVEQAAANRVLHDAAAAQDLPALASMLDHVLLADLPRAVPALIDRIADIAAVGAEVRQLMGALPNLVRTLRYGNVRKTDVALVEPVVRGLAERICAGLGPACASLDDDAASDMISHISAVDAALTTLGEEDLLADWRARLHALADADVHGLVAGRCCRLLLDGAAETPEMIAVRLSAALSRGNDPAKASAWLEGFLADAGAILVHDARLLGIIDAWLCSLPAQVFDEVCPLVRRTLSTFTPPERRMIGERLVRESPSLATNAVPTKSADAQTAVEESDYISARGEQVLPVLRTILGEPLP